LETHIKPDDVTGRSDATHLEAQAGSPHELRWSVFDVL